MPKQRKSESRVPRRAKALLKAISRCRHPECPVVARHPFIHPGYLMRVPYGKLSKEHWSKHLPAAFEFIKELGIKQFRNKVGVKDRNLKKDLKEIEIESKHEIDHGATRVTL